jgi:hypothetical protein
MVRVECIKDADGVTLRFDEEYEIALSPQGFHAMANLLAEVAQDSETAQVWVFDPDDEEED